MSASPTITLPVSHLQPNPFQPRDKVKKEEIAELVESIKVYGVLEPLVVAETPAGYQIIAGERRWRAAKMAGLTEVPVHVRKTTPKGMLEMAIVENVQRTDLNPIERAQAFQRLMRDFGLTTGDVAKRVGKSASFVSNSLKLLTLPDAISDGLLGQQISEGHARALLAIGDEKHMVECYKIVLKENASVRRAEELARRYKEAAGADSPTHGRPITQPDEQIKAWQAKLQQIFTRPAKFKLVRTRTQTKVSITLKGSPESTQQDLEKILRITNLETD